MKRLLLLSLTIRVTMAFAQLTPIYNVPSPEIANLGTYGTIPVSHFTGIPDISIPLYDVKVGNYTLPLTAKYHLAIVKPHTQPGPLGLGWSLDAGGYITRTVRFIYDEKQNSSGHSYGFYGHATELQNIHNAVDYKNFIDAHLNLNEDVSNTYYELSPDEFSFSFCGYSGNFYYNEYGGWTVVSDDDIKVEFEPQTGFLTWQQLNQRFHEQGWLNTPKNNRFFNKFTLVTPDGSRYEFGGLYATEYSINYYARNTSDLIPTTWRLTKITTSDKHVITLTYSAEERICDIRYVPYQQTCYNYYSYPYIHPQTAQKGWNAFTGFLVFPVELVKIETENDTIDFTYEDDISYRNHFINTRALYWGDDPNDPPSRFDPYGIMYEHPSAQYNVFVGANMGNNSEMNRQAIIDSLKCKSLHRICVTKNQDTDSHYIYFKYNHNNRRKLTDIVFRDGQYPLEPNASGITWHVPENSSKTDMPEYHFTYNENPMSVRYAFSKTDSWGYWYGSEIVMTNEPTFNIIFPSYSNTLAQTLSSIQFPTGGITEFKYDVHTCSQVLGIDHQTLENGATLCGGLRIKEIWTMDRDSNLISKKKYYYAENKGSSSSSGILREWPATSILFELGDNKRFELKSMGGFFPSVTNLNSPDVGYTYVIEETLDGTGNSMGYIKYSYSNYGVTTPDGDSHVETAPLYSVNCSGNSPIVPYTSNSASRGKLLRKEYYDGDDNFLKEEIYTYRKINNFSILSPLQYFVKYGYEYNGVGLIPLYTFLGWMPQTYTYSYLPIKVSVSEYGENDEIITEHSYAYNNYKMLSSDSLLCSNGTMSVTSYSYPYDFNSPPYTWMAFNHYLQPVVSKVYTCGGKTRTTISSYALSSNNVPYLQKAQTSYGSTVRDEYEVIAADQYGNPVEIMQDSIHTVLVWGHFGQLLVAKIVNTTISQLATIANINPVDVSTLSRNDIPYTALANAKQSLSGSMFDIYKYTSGLLLRSHEAPNGYTTYYAYDESGRLRKTGYVDEKIFPVKAKILNQYDYRFYYNNRNVE